jgi:hypothetical protein
MLRKVMQFSDGRWLFRRDHGYSLGSDSIPYEDAIVMLVEHAFGLPDRTGELEKFQYFLKRRMPKEDWDTVAKQIDTEFLHRERARHEKWIIEMLQLTEPPDSPPYWNADWEDLHRLAVEPFDPGWSDWSGIFKPFHLNYTFHYAELWHFVQRYRPPRCPLRLWEVCYDARFLQYREEGQAKVLQTSRVLAFSENTARGIYSDDFEVIGVKEIDPSTFETQPASDTVGMSDSQRAAGHCMKHFIVVKLKGRDFPVQGQIAPALPMSPFKHFDLEVQGQFYGQTQVEWVDGSQDGREVAAAAGYAILDPSAWCVYGPAYRMESVAAGKRKAAARHTEEVV